MKDMVERSTRIEAPLDRVWDLVTQPGWWVPDDGEAVGERQVGAVTVRESAKHGRFPVTVERLDPQTCVAFRWEYPRGDRPVAPATLVEFFVQQVEGAVEVRVVETGFASFGDGAGSAVTENTSGWEAELGSLHDRAENAA